MSFRSGNRFNRGGGSRTATTTTTATSATTTSLKAKCAENQAGLDRLSAKYTEWSSRQNSNYCFTIKKAMKSLQECPHPITTQKEAVALKFVGPRLAMEICPNNC